MSLATDHRATPASYALDGAGTIRVPRGGANAAALLRIGLGLLYLWAFIEAFGVGYTNSSTSASGKLTYGWNFSYDASKGWISSGFTHSPTAGFVSTLHGPVGWVIQQLPTGIADFGWTFAMAGLGVALTLGIFMTIAGWGGFALNIILWFSAFPPAQNPVIDGEHMAFAFSILLLMYLQAGNRWGFGRWWRAHTPALLH